MCGSGSLWEGATLHLLRKSIIFDNIHVIAGIFLFWKDTSSVLSSSRSVHRFNVMCTALGLV